MLAHWSIRNKLLFCIVTLFLIVTVLSFSSFRGVYAYRELARSISYQRANELSWHRNCLSRGRDAIGDQPTDMRIR